MGREKEREGGRGGREGGGVSNDQIKKNVVLVILASSYTVNGSV